MRGGYNEETTLEDPAETAMLTQPWARQEMTTVLKILGGTPNLYTLISQTKKPDHPRDSILSEDNSDRVPFWVQSY